MIKAVILALVTGISFSVAAQQEIIRDGEGNKIIKGFLTQKELVADTAFSWYAQNQKGFTPNTDAVTAFKAQKDSVHILVFGGTWCGDTKSLLPKFFALTDAAGFAQNRITLLGVDRSKKTVHHLSEAFGITNVPTFIVLKNGKEIGRVVEYGKYGMVDKELGEIVNRK
ncbi:MAG TPA: thioredoxin family protein [Flavisolibacter sp.]|nr:thioredoxin family protein [Flavisolibacter sp.]